MMSRKLLLTPFLILSVGGALDAASLLRRSLAMGDFDSFNAVLDDLSFPLPNQTITQDVAGSTLSIDLIGLVCSGLNIGDVQVSYQETETLNITLNVLNADISCQTQYYYRYLFFSGGGTGYITTQDNNATLNLSLTSDADSLMQEPPSVSIVSCDSTVNVADLQLDGNGAGIVAEIINALEFALKDLVASQIKTFLCQEVSSLQTVLQSGLDNLYDVLSLDLPETDPLDAEKALDQTVDWLDFLNPTSWLENAFVMLFDQAQDLLVNNIDALWANLLDDDGSLLVDTQALGIETQTIPSFLGDFTFGLESVRIFGLDTMNVTNLTVIGASTLAAQLSVGSVRVELDSTFALKAGDQQYSENPVVSIELDDISVQLSVLVAVDEGELGDVALGSILRENWECLLQAVKKFAVTQLEVEVTAQEPTVTGINSPGLDRLVQDAASQMFDTYGSVLNTALPMWIEAAMMELNLTLPSPEETNCTALGDLADDREFIDFRDLFLTPNTSVAYGGSGLAPYGSLVAPVKGYIASVLSNSSTLSNLLDMVIAPLTKSGGASFARSSSDVLVWKTPLINFSGGIEIGGLDADIAVLVDELKVENLNTLSNATVLDPVRGQPHWLNNSVSLGMSKPLRLSARVLFELKVSDDPNETVSNDIVVSVEMDSIQLMVPVIAKLMTSRVMNFPIQDMLTWQCWLAAIPAPTLDAQGVRDPKTAPTLSILDVGFSAQSMNFTVDCLNCTSPKFEELSTLLNMPQSDLSATESAEHVIEYILSLLTGDPSIAQTAIDRMLVDAPRFCPHSSEFEPNATKAVYESAPPVDPNTAATFLYAMLISVLVLIAAAIISVVALKCIVSRRNRTWLATLPQEQVVAIYENQQAQKQHELALDMASESLIRSKELPLFVRWFIPVVIFGNIALFLSGHLSIGGEVRIYLQIGGQTLVVSDFYTFSIAQSGIELWNAGAKAIAILMLLFSGVWPYLKQILTLALWVMPPRFVSISRRGSVLLWLDTLAKWSMIDVFVMIVTLAAFHVTIKSPDKPFLPEDFYQVDLLVAPLWGLYANMMAQLVSQVSSHFIIYYHRLVASAAAGRVEDKRRALSGEVSFDAPPEQATGSLSGDDSGDVPKDKATVAGELAPGVADTSAGLADTSADDSHSDEKRALCKHAFTRPHRGESAKLQARSWANTAFMFLCVSSTVLLLVGCIMPSYSFDYLGLIGIAVESGNDFEEARVYLSVISTAQLLMDQARFLGTAKDFVGLLSIAIVLVMTSLIVPIAQVATLVVEWLVPVRRVVSSRLRVAIEIFQAWQYVEVFLLSVIVAVWQIGDVSTFLVNDYCGNLGGLFATLVSNGVLDPADGQCFRSQASIEPASYVLIAASIVLIVLTSFVSKATVQRDREDNEQHLLIPTTSSVTLDDGDEAPPSPIDTITNIPVLFTDQYRWLLMTSEQ